MNRIRFRCRTPGKLLACSLVRRENQNPTVADFPRPIRCCCCNKGSDFQTTWKKLRKIVQFLCRQRFAEIREEAWHSVTEPWKSVVESKTILIYLHNFIFRVLLCCGWIGFRFSFRSLRWRWRLFILWKWRKTSLSDEFGWKDWCTHHFMSLIMYISIVLNWWRKHLSVGVGKSTVPHVRIHHPIVRILLLLNYREHNRQWSIKFYDYRKDQKKRDLTEYQ